MTEIEKQFTRGAGVSALRRAEANLRRYRSSVLNGLFDVPWPLLEISEIGKTVTGATPPTKDPKNYGTSLPFIKPTDLNVGYRVENARQYLSAEGARRSRVLPANTVLVTCIGATIGKTGLARMPCATNQQINPLIPNENIAKAEWLYWALSSPRGQELIKSSASATTLPILNKRRFEALRLPIPPLSLQNEIISDVQSAISAVDATNRQVRVNLKRVETLRRAILNAVFRDP